MDGWGIKHVRGVNKFQTIIVKNWIIILNTENVCENVTIFSYGTRNGPMAGFFEHGNEPLGKKLPVGMKDFAPMSSLDKYDKDE